MYHHPQLIHHQKYHIKAVGAWTASFSAVGSNPVFWYDGCRAPSVNKKARDLYFAPIFFKFYTHFRFPKGYFYLIRVWLKPFFGSHVPRLRMCFTNFSFKNPLKNGFLSLPGKVSFHPYLCVYPHPPKWRPQEGIWSPDRSSWGGGSFFLGGGYSKE